LMRLAVQEEAAEVAAAGEMEERRYRNHRQ
jgi:hypothetical protein